MPKNNHKFNKFLVGKVARAEIMQKENDDSICRKGIVVFLLDDISEKEESTGPISVKVIDKEKDCICSYLKMHSWPSCDYLYTSIKTVARQEVANLYLIEQTDITETFRDKMQIKNKSKLNKSDEIIITEFKKLQKKDAEHGAKLNQEGLKFIAKLVIHNLVSENRQKFHSSLSIMFKLTRMKSLADSLPKRQAYNFVILDVPRQINRLKAGDISIRKRLKKDLEKQTIDDLEKQDIEKYLTKGLDNHRKDIHEQTYKAITGLSNPKDDIASISIGTVISGYNDLIKHINNH